MAYDNPFSALPTGFGNAAEGEIVRDGKFVRTPLTAVWPARCVVCNRSVPAADYKAKLQWYPRWIPLFFLISWIIVLILVMVKRRWVNLHIGLCDAHREARRMRLFGFGGATALGVLVLIVGGAEESGLALGFGCVAFLVGLIGWLVSLPVLRVHKVEGETAWVIVKEPFLNSLGGG